MQDNKYYEPVLDDFSYGLEYEFLTGGKNWGKFTFNEDRAPQVLMNVKEKPEMFRIPYLTKEDIEAERFPAKVISDGDGYFERGKYTIGFRHWRREGVLRGSVTISMNDDGNNVILFHGKLKNKSELRRILKMIGV